jgi:NAD(P)-dependent dehydrogenase (short-subunit alcohol dehydrogenase family)
MPKTRRCDEALLAKDLSGKTYIVTGSNSGIGLVTTRQLVKQGAHVVMACRRTNVAQEVADELMAESPRGGVEVIALDLGDLASVRAFADAFLSSHDRLDALVNNAGVMKTPEGTTKDGFEWQMGVNHLGHFLLTEKLLDLLKASAPSRIIILSSCFHDKAFGRQGEIRFEDLHFQERAYDGWAAYAQSKLANLLHAKELARRLEGTGVTAVSVHPGWVRTQLVRHSSGPIWIQNTLLRPLFALLGQIGEWDGAQTTLHCLLDDDVANHGGAYFSQVGLYRDKSCNPGGWPLQSPNPQAHLGDVSSRLWDVSAKAVGSRVSPPMGS